MAAFPTTGTARSARLVGLFLAIAATMAGLPAQTIGDDPAARRAEGVWIEGLLTDADKNKIPDFEVFIGQPAEGGHDIRWKRESEAIGEGGRFKLFMPDHAVPFVLRIEAPGYRNWISETFTDEQPERRLFVQLESGPVLTGRVLTPENQPAAGAVVTLITKEHSFQFTAGYEHHGGRRTIMTKADGRFQFVPPEENYLLVATHESGYLELFREKHELTGDLPLEAWAQLDVTVVEGARRRPQVEVWVQPERLSGRTPRVSSYGLSGVTDERGQVFFDKLPPWTLYVSQTDSSEDGSRRWTMRSVQAELRPGETTAIKIGGSGAEVIGRLTLTGQPLFPHQWEANDLLSLREPYKPGKPASRFSQRARIAADGSFRLPDVPPGEYMLMVSITSSEQRTDRGGLLFRPIVVPRDVPRHDLGDVSIAWDKVLGPGDPTARFVVTDQEGRVIRDQDYRGRFLLLSFWNRPDRASQPIIAGLVNTQREFANDPRVGVLSLVLAATTEEVRRTVSTAGSIGDWALIGQQSGALVSERFHVRRWPDYLLIDPAGTIVARDANLEPVLQSLREARSAWDFSQPLPAHPKCVSTVLVDPFDSPAPIALAACLNNIEFLSVQHKHCNGPGLLLWGADGAAVRRLDDVGTSAWLTGPERMAFDLPRNRLYVCDTANERLVALDLMGRRLFETPLPKLHSVTVDPQTGELWCLIVSMLSSGETIVLDTQGNERLTLPHTGFRIDPIPESDRFWVSGETIREIDRDGRLQREFPLPPELNLVMEVVHDEAGGAWVLGDAREDLQGRSLWRVQHEGTFQLLHQFPRTTVARGLERVGTELWCAVVNNYERGAEGPFAREIQRFDLSGQPLAPLAVPARRLFVSDDGARIWVELEQQLAAIDLQGNILRRLELPEPPVAHAIVR